MYFDPGMGSLIIQTIIAGIAVIGGYFAYAKTGLKGLFKKKGRDDTTEINADKKTNEDDDEL